MIATSADARTYGRCAIGRAHVYALSKEAVVFEDRKREEVVLCLRRTGREETLGDTENCPSQQERAYLARLAGKYLAYTWSSCPITGNLYVSLVDLHSDKTIRTQRATSVKRENASDILELILKPNGSFAWLGTASYLTGGPDLAGETVSEVTTFDSTHRRVRLDRLVVPYPPLKDDGSRDPAETLTTLRLAADRRTLSWLHHGEMRTASLD